MAEPVFVPKPGQVDYTHIRYLPVMNCLVFNAGKLLLVQRSDDMRTWPGIWHCIGGYLDDDKTIEDKALEELWEEAGISTERVTSMQRFAPILREDNAHGKTLFTVPVRADIVGYEYTLNWESQAAIWIDPAEVGQYNLLPGFAKIVADVVSGRN
ncbi:NUDIX domain-containing protein [Aeromicrobium sp.]|nr:NUDIX domain-containing protein [Candidatus Saccharibacteria bacterium]